MPCKFGCVLVLHAVASAPAVCWPQVVFFLFCWGVFHITVAFDLCTGPELGPIASIMIAPEEGSWRVDEVRSSAQLPSVTGVLPFTCKGWSLSHTLCPR